MIVHDFECQDCGVISEAYITTMKHIPTTGICPDCGGKTKRIISMSYTAPIDSPWIGSVLEVVDKHSNEPHCKEFLRHPTRDNYKKWMTGEGLRPLEPGERSIPKQTDRAERKANIKHKLMQQHRERNAVSVNTI